MTSTRSGVTPRELLVDVAIAAGLTALSLLALAAGAPDLGPSGPLNVGLLLLQTVPLAVRRLAPIPVLVIIFAAIAVQLMTVPVGEDLRSSGGPLVAMYTIGERVERRWGMPLLVSVLVLMAAMMMQHIGAPDGIQSLIQTNLFLIAAWYMDLRPRSAPRSCPHEAHPGEPALRAAATVDADAFTAAIAA